MTTSKKYKGFLILLNKESGYYDIYLPEDAEEGIRYCRDFASPDWDGCGTIEEAQQWIDSY